MKYTENGENIHT